MTHHRGSGSYRAINYLNDTDVQIVRDKDGLITTTADASGTTTNVYYPSQWLKTMTGLRLCSASPHPEWSRGAVSAGTSKTITYQYNGVVLASRMAVGGELHLFRGAVASPERFSEAH